jgi:hypothetical protein
MASEVWNDIVSKAHSLHMRFYSEGSGAWYRTRSLEGVIERRGKPEAIRCDNGPELTSRHFLSWCEERKIQLIHIQPGRPMQNWS